MRFSSQLVIDAGAGHVAAARFRAGSAGKLVLEEIRSQSRSPDPVRDPDWVADVTGAFEASPGSGGLRGPATWAVAGHLTLTKFVQTPAVRPALREQVIRFEAEQNLPFPLGTLAWDHAVIADGSEGAEVMLTAAKSEVMERLCTAAENSGAPVKQAVAACVALHRAYRFNYPAGVEPVLVVDIGARSTNVLIAGPGGRFFARTLLLGGNFLTAAIADEMKVDFATAEQTKLDVFGAATGSAFDQPAKRALERVAMDFAGQLQREIMRTMGSFGWRTGSPSPVRLYLTGGGSLVPGLEAGLANGLKVPVERYDALRNVELAEAARRSVSPIKSQELANLVGLAAMACSQPSSDAGLVPAGVRAARASRRRQRIVLSAAALLVAALVPAGWYLQRSVKRQQARAAAIAAQLPPLRAQVQRNQAMLARLSAMGDRIAATRRVVEARTTWSELLGDLEDRLGGVGDAWLEQLSVVPPEVSPRSDRREGKPTMVPAVQLRLTGRLFDMEHPTAATGENAQARVKALLASIAASPFVASLGDEHFDAAERGTLRFAFTLTLNPARLL